MKRFISNSPRFSPILLTPGAFPHVQSVDEFRAFLIVACELFATFAGHKLFQLVQLHFGVAMNTFIGSLFRRDLSLAHFAAKIERMKSFPPLSLSRHYNGKWWSDDCQQRDSTMSHIVFLSVTCRRRREKKNVRNSFREFPLCRSNETDTPWRVRELRRAISKRTHTAFNCNQLFITNRMSFSVLLWSQNYQLRVIIPTVSLSANLMN